VKKNRLSSDFPNGFVLCSIAKHHSITSISPTQPGAMRFPARVVPVILAVRSAAFRSRKKREQFGVVREGGASVEKSASSIVMNEPCLVHYILEFVGPGQHLYVSTISKLVRRCYGTVQAVELQAYRILGSEWTKAIVTHQETLCREMCASKARLLLAVECRVQLAPHASLLQRTVHFLITFNNRRKVLEAASNTYFWVCNLSLSVGRYADRALLTFAYEKLCLSYFSEYVTLGAIMSGDLDKLQWLRLAKRAEMSRESSVMAARFGHTNILQWFYQMRFPIHSTACCEAAIHGHLDSPAVLL
jgi:hypothetical protein